MSAHLLSRAVSGDEDCSDMVDTSMLRCFFAERAAAAAIAYFRDCAMSRHLLVAAAPRKPMPNALSYRRQTAQRN